MAGPILARHAGRRATPGGNGASFADSQTRTEEEEPVMQLPKVILVPTDFGEPSEAALDHAVSLARALGGQIVLMHAYDIPMIAFPEAGVIASTDLTARIGAGAQSGLEQTIASREGSGVP